MDEPRGQARAEAGKELSTSSHVMAGLDPAIHAATAQDFEMDGRLGGRP